MGRLEEDLKEQHQAWRVTGIAQKTGSWFGRVEGGVEGRACGVDE